MKAAHLVCLLVCLRKQSDKAWQEMILSSEANQLLIKNAVTAVKRDNLDAYWAAIGQVDCMEDY